MPVISAAVSTDANSQISASARQVRISAERDADHRGQRHQVAITPGANRSSVSLMPRRRTSSATNFRSVWQSSSGGTAMILAGGATPVEQKRRAQLIEDAINATRAALEEGVVPGGGVALLRAAPALDPLIASLTGSATARCGASAAGADATRFSASPPIAVWTARPTSTRSQNRTTASASMRAPEASLTSSRPASSIPSRSATARCATRHRSRD